MCFGGSNKENKQFTRQNEAAFQTQQQQTDLFRGFFADLHGMLGEQYGMRKDIFNLLSDNLVAASSYGPGQLQPNANDFFRENGYLPTDGQQTSGTGVTGGSFQERVAQARAAREARVASGGSANPWDWTPMSGYDPSMFQSHFTPRRFYASEGAALRSQLSEEATDAYGDAEAAFGQRAMQMGGYGPGIEAAALRDMEAAKASAQMEGQRKAILFGAQNMRDDMRAFAPLTTQLQLAQAEAFQKEAAMQNQIMAQQAAQKAQAAAQARAIAAASRAAGAAQRAAAQQFSAAQRQRAAEFAAEMKLKGAQFNSENFFRSIGAMSGLAGQMDPSNYAQLALGSLNGPMGPWANMYNTSAQGMVNTRQPSFWGNLLGGLAGGALNFATGGLGSMFGGGGGSSAGNWGGTTYLSPRLGGGGSGFYGPGY